MYIIYICIYIHTYLYTYVCIYVYMYIHTYICIYVFTYVYVYISILLYLFQTLVSQVLNRHSSSSSSHAGHLFLPIFTYIYIDMYIYMYILIHIYVHLFFIKSPVAITPSGKPGFNRFEHIHTYV